MNGRLYEHTANRYDPTQPQVPEGWQISTGLAPRGIIHRFYSQDRGVIGNDVVSFPTTSGQAFLPHRAVVKRPVGRASRQGLATIDETAYIPAFAVGDPRR
jgi:hypothetical protein